MSQDTSAIVATAVQDLPAPASAAVGLTCPVTGLSFSTVYYGRVKAWVTKGEGRCGLSLVVEGQVLFLPGRYIPRHFAGEQLLGRMLPVLLHTEVPKRRKKKQQQKLLDRAKKTPVLDCIKAYEKLRHDWLVETLEAWRKNPAMQLDGVVERYSLPEGQKTKGAIIRINDFVTGFAHRVRISFNRTVDVEDALSIGEHVKVRIKDICLHKDRLHLDTRLATIPVQALEQLEIGEKLDGEVFYAMMERKAKNQPEVLKALLISLPSKVVGYAQVSGEVHIGDLDKRLPVGSKVTVVVKDKNGKLGQVSVGFDPMVRTMCEDLASRVGEVFDCTISSIKDFGIFVGLHQLVDGLVQRDALPNKSVKGYQPGDRIKVQLVSAHSEEDDIPRRFNCKPVEMAVGAGEMTVAAIVETAETTSETQT